MKIVINTNFGGFGLSAEAEQLLADAGIKMEGGAVMTDLPCDFRAHPALVSVVETLGDKASAEYAQLKVVEIPDGVDWYTTEHDGNETIHEGRTWR